MTDMDRNDSIQPLIARSLAAEDGDSDERWDPIRLLHQRGDRSTFDVAAALCRSPKPAERCLGADILAQLGLGERPFLEERLPILTGLAEVESDLAVLYSALCALGHLHDPRALPPLLQHRRHRDRDIRFAVVLALPSCLVNHEDRAGIAALLELMEDQDDEIRDWATMGLGSCLKADGPEIRDALARRLSDASGDTAGEAMVGLARRHDARSLEPIRRALASSDVGNLAVEAATELGDPRLLPALEALDRDGWASDDPRGRWLTEAIARCSTSQRS